MRRKCNHLALLLLFFCTSHLLITTRADEIVSGVLMLSHERFDDVVDGSKNVLVLVHDSHNTPVYLYEIAHAFHKEEDVLVASMYIDANSFTLWKQSHRLFNVDKFPAILLFRKRTSDGECLLPEHLSPHKLPVVYNSEEKGAELIIDFVNQKSGKYRQLDGELSIEGIKKKQILNNLFHSRDATTCDRIEMPSRETFLNDYVAKSKPVVITGALKNWSAMTKWTNKYLRAKLGDKKVNVKLTPDGQFEGCESLDLWDDNSITVPDYVYSRLQSPDKAVVRPANYKTDFDNFMDMLYDEKLNTSFYLEYCSIKSDLPELLDDIASFPFANFLHESLTNIWLGNGRTVGKLHFDEYDNLLCQISGKKTLTIFDPNNNENFYEGYIREAVLSYSPHSDSFHRNTLSDSTSLVMSPVDLTHPDLVRYPLFANASPMTCTIEAGDILYLPSFWWHEVKSSPDDLKRNIAVNYWYTPFLDKHFPCASCRLFVNPFYDLWQNVTV